ncbi:hypothetical protein [Methylobacterium sp.]|uniref:hypothetical protein n=1 Tax=Methylobacterium sp. TaxID=409 RepID=UPI003AFF884B
MCDDPTISSAAVRSMQSIRSLNRIAELLGVPASSFYSQDGSHTELSGAAILDLIDAHLAAINSERQKNFLAAVHAVVEAHRNTTTDES